MVGALVWDPDRIFFRIPFIDYPITWYGCFFAFGFMIGYLIMRTLFTSFLKKEGVDRSKEVALNLMDKFAVVGAFSAVIGARLGYVFFYGWPYYRHHPLDILKIWEGGLASHGAALAVLVGIFFFVRVQRKHFPFLTFFVMLDALVVAAGFAGGCIRIGNFMNQEITGLPSSLPWAISFLHPMDNVAAVPLHPVQLYESLFYFALFLSLCFLWRLRDRELGKGFLSGCFFLALFTFRFFIEFLKVHQGEVLSPEFPLRMGQLLSLPFVLVGLFFLIRGRRAQA